MYEKLNFYPLCIHVSTNCQHGRPFLQPERQLVCIPEEEEKQRGSNTRQKQSRGLILADLGPDSCQRDASAHRDKSKTTTPLRPEMHPGKCVATL